MQKQQITNRIRKNRKFILEVIKCMNYGLGEKKIISFNRQIVFL